MQKSPGHIKQISERTEKMKYELGEVKVVITCDAHEVERIIEKEYGFKEFSIVASEETGNYTTKEFRVDGEVDDPDEVEKRYNRYMTREYLNDLARQGKIQKGTYMVDVSW